MKGWRVVEASVVHCRQGCTAVSGRAGGEAVVQGWGEAGEWVGSGKGGGVSTAVQGWGAVEAGVVHCLQGCAPVSGRGMGRGQQRRGGERQGKGERAAAQRWGAAGVQEGSSRSGEMQGNGAVLKWT